MHSTELTRLLIASAQECDVVLKAICKHEKHFAVREYGYNIEHYREKIPLVDSQIGERRIILCLPDLEFYPFRKWEKKAPPDLWDANNDVKHARAQCYTKGNLKNILSAFAALLIVNLLYYQRIGELSKLEPAPRTMLPRSSMVNYSQSARGQGLINAFSYPDSALQF